MLKESGKITEGGSNMFHVIKRNGDTADFTLTKINDVIMEGI